MFDFENVGDIDVIAVNEAYGLPVLPRNLTKDKDGLYVMEDGKYLPDSAYLLPNGDTLIYEKIRNRMVEEMSANLPME